MQNKINYFTKTTHPIYQQNKHLYKSKKKVFPSNIWMVFVGP